MHKESNFYLYVSHLHHHSIVFRYSWLQKHDPHICWKENTITFDSSFCQSHCLSKSSPVTISGLGKSESEPPQITPASTSTFFGSSPNVMNPDASKLHLNIARIGAAPFTMLIKKPGHKVFTVNLRDLDQVVKPPWKPALDTSIDPSTIVLLEYHKFFDVFSCQKLGKIFPYRAYNHHISLKKGTEPLFGPLYNISREENEELCKYLFENLDKGFIRASQSPTASSVLFVQKPRGVLRFCVDYRGLNAITVKN